MGRWPWVLSASQADTQPSAAHSSPEPSKALSATPQPTSQHPSPPVTPLEAPAAQALLDSCQLPLTKLICRSALGLDRTVWPTGTWLCHYLLCGFGQVISCPGPVSSTVKGEDLWRGFLSSTVLQMPLIFISKCKACPWLTA